MVLESITNPFKAEKNPWQMFFIGLIYASVAIMLSMFLFEEYTSIIIITLIVIASSHIMYLVIKFEEKKDLYIEDEAVLMKEHTKALSFFMFLFLGLAVGFTLWYIMLPSTTTTQLFELQLREISKVEKTAIPESDLTGYAAALSQAVLVIFLNNLKVMAFCLFFSFIFGMGAIFILTWNASILGVAMGAFAVNNMHHGFLMAFSKSILRYMVHGIPEIIAFFIAGLAGGIISVAVIKHNLNLQKSKHILMDTFDLMLVAVVMLFMAALIEVYVTPTWFY